MEKQEFIKIKEQIKENISALKDELIRAENRYIESKRKFSNGTKVKITIPEHKAWTISRGKHENVIVKEEIRYAFVVGYKIDYDNEVGPVLKRCKKDGTISKITEYADTRRNTIEAVE